ncbi:hypothetical protein BSLG_008561 [Batrachochytrium salamandrivorans]|nr:hypothetical protein BSLG_008561 [Batrachochytrium salamandrivorans]
MALPRVAQLLTLYNVRSKKVLGQNFLLNPIVTDRIARYTAPKKTDGRVLHVEVGPGPGGLTRSVLKAGATHLIAVEKDLTMSPLLGQLRDSTPGRFRYILDDMLLSDQLVLFDRIMAQAAECDQEQQIVFEEQLPQPQPSQDDHPIISTATETSFDKVHLVGNLPYSISSQLLAMWMQQAAARQYLFSFPTTEMTLMFQRELCERIEAPAGTKLRGRLSVVCQALFNVKMVTTVDRKLFKPVPKVDGGILRFVPHAEDKLKDIPYDTFVQLVKVLHHHPNSTIRAILKRHHLDAVCDLLPTCGIDPASRSFMLQVDAFIQLARQITKENIQIVHTNPLK